MCCGYVSCRSSWCEDCLCKQQRSVSSRHVPTRSLPCFKGGVIRLPTELPPCLWNRAEGSSTLFHVCGHKCKHLPRLSAHVLAENLCAVVSCCPSVLCAQDAEPGIASPSLQSHRFLFKKPPSFEVLQCSSTSCFDLSPSQPENRLVISFFSYQWGLFTYPWTFLMTALHTTRQL